jgi:hypothetical protein
LIQFLNWRTHIVIAGLVPAISARMVRLCQPKRDGRDIRAFTPVLTGYGPAMTRRT